MLRHFTLAPELLKYSISMVTCRGIDILTEGLPRYAGSRELAGQQAWLAVNFL